MPDQVWIQYGSFGIVFLILVGGGIWFIRSGFPQMLVAMHTLADRVMLTVEKMDDGCRAERREQLAAFRTESEKNREMMERISKSDMEARHKQGEVYQRQIIEMFEYFTKQSGGFHPPGVKPKPGNS